MSISTHHGLIMVREPGWALPRSSRTQERCFVPQVNHWMKRVLLSCLFFYVIGDGSVHSNLHERSSQSRNMMPDDLWTLRLSLHHWMHPYHVFTVDASATAIHLPPTAPDA